MAFDLTVRHHLLCITLLSNGTLLRLDDWTLYCISKLLSDDKLVSHAFFLSLSFYH